jgi:hypothetical protein
MFRVIGGIVVYGFALYGVATLMSRSRLKQLVEPEPDIARDGSSGHATDPNRQREDGQIVTEVGA